MKDIDSKILIATQQVVCENKQLSEDIIEVEFDNYDPTDEFDVFAKNNPEILLKMSQEFNQITKELMDKGMFQ